MDYLLLSFIVATYWLSAAQNTYFSKACKRIFSPEYMYVYILIWDYLANAGDDTGMSDCALLLWWDIPLVALMQGLLPRLSDFPRHSILSMCKPHLPRLQPQVGEQQEPSWGFSSNNCGAGKKKELSAGQRGQEDIRSSAVLPKYFTREISNMCTCAINSSP